MVPAVLYQTKAPFSEVTSPCRQRKRCLEELSVNLVIERLISVVYGLSFVYYVYVCVCSDTLFHVLILKCILKNFLCCSKLITLLFHLEFFNSCVKQNHGIIVCYSVIFPCSLIFRLSYFLHAVSLPMCRSLVSHI